MTMDYQFYVCDKHFESRTKDCLYCEIEQLRVALQHMAENYSVDSGIPAKSLIAGVLRTSDSASPEHTK